MFVRSAGARPASARIECSRNAVVVLPFVPVTATTSSSRDGSPKNAAAVGPIASRTLGTTCCGTSRSSAPLDDERDGAPFDRLGGKLVPIPGRTGDAEEERTRRHRTRVVGQVADLDPEGVQVHRGRD